MKKVSKKFCHVKNYSFLCKVINNEKQEIMTTIKFLDKVRSEMMGFDVYVVIEHEGCNVYSKMFFYTIKVNGKNECYIFNAKCTPHKTYIDKKGKYFKVTGTLNKLIGKIYI